MPLLLPQTPPFNYLTVIYQLPQTLTVLLILQALEQFSSSPHCVSCDQTLTVLLILQALEQFSSSPHCVSCDQTLTVLLILQALEQFSSSPHCVSCDQTLTVLLILQALEQFSSSPHCVSCDQTLTVLLILQALEQFSSSPHCVSKAVTKDARQKFRSVLVEATVKLDELVKKIGKAVEESKPYWEARRVARQAQLEAQRATQDFQRATEVLRAAKETIALAEQRLLEEDTRQFDSAWQEMLNHATQRVMEAEHTKTRSELVHKETAAKYTAAMGRMKQLEKKLKRTINKSKPYFELKAKYYLQLEHLKKNVDELQAKLSQAKEGYKTALRNLEMISDEIHERRRNSAMGPRVRGVGADGDSVAVDDIASFKMESDGISMTSESFEDETCSSSAMSEEDSETRSTCSLGSSSHSPNSLQDLPSPCPFVSSSSPCPSSSSPAPSSRPCSLDLPSPVSLSDFGLISPVLGPRSECSGASSPECDLERGDRAEGAEGKLDNTVNNNITTVPNTNKTTVLEGRLSFLSLRRSRNDSTKNAKRERQSRSQTPTQTVVLINGV
ncbi:SH3 domain-binding protein 5-like [Salvelinus namaycush]|uniref:SH3 domain-binding protein 5 n=1 Tax=Salvelinus namaycush TaxID=8040 RepID=A0A8U0PYP7_SALNM|nr:SH3 domain-binding protein 5-like [Salvelinus namaycush]